MSEVSENERFEFSDASKNCLLKKLYQQQQQQTSQNLDLKIKMGGKEINMHAFLLAAESDSCKNIVTGQPYIRKCLDISGLTSNYSDLEITVKYIYTREVCLDENNVEGVLRICGFFSFSRLKKHVKQFLLNRMNPSNCLSIWRIAKTNKLRDIEKMSLILIQEIFWSKPMLDCIRYSRYKYFFDLLENARYPQNVFEALVFLHPWMAVDPPERMRLIQDFFITHADPHYKTLAMKQLSIQRIETSELSSFTGLMLLSYAKNTPPCATKDWFVVLKERDTIAIYFAEESIWIQLYGCLTGKIAGATRESIVIIDEIQDHIIMWNIKNWSRTFIPFPERARTICSAYFCSKDYLHHVTCKRVGTDMKVEVMTYKETWEFSACSRYRNWSGINSKFVIHHHPHLTDAFYIVLTWCTDGIFTDNPDKLCIIVYDISTKQLTYIFESNYWDASTNYILNKYDTQYIIGEKDDQPIFDQLKSGFLNATLLSTENTISLPIPKRKRSRPKNVTLSNDIPSFLNRFKTTTHFRTCSSSLFLMEVIAPFITRIDTLDLTNAEKWITLPPCPIPTVDKTSFDVFTRYADCVWLSNVTPTDDKTLHPNCHPFINMHIDDWKGTMEIIDIDETKYL